MALKPPQQTTNQQQALATALRLAAQQQTVTALEVYANTPQQPAQRQALWHAHQRP